MASSLSLAAIVPILLFGNCSFSSVQSNFPGGKSRYYLRVKLILYLMNSSGKGFHCIFGLYGNAALGNNRSGVHAPIDKMHRNPVSFTP